MIRLANVREFGVLRRCGVAGACAPPRRHFSGAAGGGDGNGGKGGVAAAAAAARGVPYSRLTVGVPMERYPLERRVAATPEVSESGGRSRLYSLVPSRAYYADADADAMHTCRVYIHISTTHPPPPHSHPHPQPLIIIYVRPPPSLLISSRPRRDNDRSFPPY